MLTEEKALGVVLYITRRYEMTVPESEMVDGDLDFEDDDPRFTEDCEYYDSKYYIKKAAD